METGFLCIDTYLESEGGGEGAAIRGGACLILWPRGWALVWRKGELAVACALILRNTAICPFLLSVVLVC